MFSDRCAGASYFEVVFIRALGVRGCIAGRVNTPTLYRNCCRWIVLNTYFILQLVSRAHVRLSTYFYFKTPNKTS